MADGLLKYRGRDNGFIGTDWDKRTFQISFALLKQLGCSQFVFAGNKKTALPCSLVCLTISGFCPEVQRLRR